MSSLKEKHLDRCIQQSYLRNFSVTRLRNGRGIVVLIVEVEVLNCVRDIGHLDSGPAGVPLRPGVKRVHEGIVIHSLQNLNRPSVIGHTGSRKTFFLFFLEFILELKEVKLTPQ